MIKNLSSKEIDILKVTFLNNWSLWDLLSELHFSSILEITWQNLIQEYRTLVKDLFVKRIELNKYNKDLKILKTKELIHRNSQLEKKTFRERLLDISEWRSINNLSKEAMLPKMLFFYWMPYWKIYSLKKQLIDL